MIFNIFILTWRQKNEMMREWNLFDGNSSKKYIILFLRLLLKGRTVLRTAKERLRLPVDVVHITTEKKQKSEIETNDQLNTVGIRHFKNSLYVFLNLFIKKKT